MLPRTKRLTRRLGRALWTAVFAAGAVLSASHQVPADERTGAQIYQSLCAACHGEQGRGTRDSHPEALAGDKPVVELAKLIAETMPDGSPEDCVGEDAQKVAAYIFDAFYSPAAQVRNRPARIEFSRLTVPQYLNAVADLVGSFGEDGPHKWGEDRGLEAEYYNSRRHRRNDRVLERRDATVDFHFGNESPLPEKIGNEEFSIRWEGSVLAPETGDYEFIVESENGARLWINDLDRALIDAWVRSGDQTEYRETIFLLGGRAYPLKLEFFKFKEPSASVALKWKRPDHAVEVIPARCLLPREVPGTFVVTTPFPPDDRSTGYVRGSSVSKAWDEATTLAALEGAATAVRLSNADDDASDRNQRVRGFCRKFVERAFRRPLSDEQAAFFVDRQFDEAPDAVAAVKRVVLLALKSPRFLYRETGLGDFDAHARASWLSFALWDALPDEVLLDAAAGGELQTREQLSVQAGRMLADPRAQAKLRGFFHQWLDFERFRDLSKDAELYPTFDEQLASDLRTSLELFVDDAAWSAASDFRQLLLSDTVWLNGRLAAFYGVELPANAAFQNVSFEPERRAGLLTHPYLMTGFAYHATSSPIHRGVFLSRSLLGRFLKPPPEAVTPLPPDLHPDLTTRERVELQTQDTSCQTCHGMINQLGFTLERFDAVGRYREQERERPINAAGSYLARSGETVELNGAREVAAWLAGSPEVHEAFIAQLFSYMMQQPIQAFGPDVRSELLRSFTEQEFNIRRLLVEMAAESTIAADRLVSE